MLLLQGCSKEQAHALLKEAGGNLRTALTLADGAKIAPQ
jgi:N-acetylmuramic acid 6-phosphate (MurNAc-6-P) etherase